MFYWMASWLTCWTPGWGRWLWGFWSAGRWGWGEWSPPPLIWLSLRTEETCKKKAYMLNHYTPYSHTHTRITTHLHIHSSHKQTHTTPYTNNYYTLLMWKSSRYIFILFHLFIRINLLSVFCYIICALKAFNNIFFKKKEKKLHLLSKHKLKM